jgi:hypothetical protein
LLQNAYVWAFFVSIYVVYSQQEKKRMNYLNTVKYDDTKRTYTDSFGYIVAPLKSTRLSVRDNEEVEESKDNIVMLQGGQSGQGVAVSADFSRDTNVDIFIEPKGTGVLKSTTDIVSNTNLENQVRLSSNNANLGIINTEGADTDIDLDLRTKGSYGSAFIKFNGDQSSYVSIVKGQATIRGNPTDLSLQPLGSGSKVRIANNSNNGGLEIVTDTPSNTGVTMQATSNQSTCNIIIQPKSGSYVSIPAPLFTTYGYMLRTHTAIQYIGSGPGVGTNVHFNTEIQNTFGTGYWSSPDKFVNNSGVTMKVRIQCWAMPETATALNQTCDMQLKVYNSGNSPIRGVGRYNLTTANTRYNTFRSDAVVLLGPNESVAWYLYVSGGTVGLMNEAAAPGTLPSGTEGLGMIIAQIP